MLCHRWIVDDAADCYVYDWSDCVSVPVETANYREQVVLFN